MIEVQVNIDCADAQALRAFYCSALGYEPSGDAEQYTSCVPGPDATGPKLVFQQVPEPKTAKNRAHLDLVVDDIETAAARFVDARCEACECGTHFGLRLHVDRHARPGGERVLPL